MFNKKILLLFFAIFSFLTFLSIYNSYNSTESILVNYNKICKGNASCLYAKVIKIIDGDTLLVEYINGTDVKTLKVRLALVNTPENGEIRYEEAKKFTESLCPINSYVIIDQDDLQLYDKYGRMIAVVYCQEKYNLNEELLKRGLAKILVDICKKSEFRNESWAKRYGC